MNEWLPPADSDLGRRVREHIENEVVIWYTSVLRDGTPLPAPVWFVLDGDDFLIYNRPRAARVLGLAARPRVSLHFNSSQQGGDIIVFTGMARPAPDAAPASAHPGYVEKYRSRMERISGSVEGFAESYPVAIRVHPERIAGR